MNEHRVLPAEDPLVRRALHDFRVTENGRRWIVRMKGEGRFRSSVFPEFNETNRRVLLELMTSMKRHGFTPRGLREAAAAVRSGAFRFEGTTIHLPLGPAGGNLPEADRLLTDIAAAGLLDKPVWVSHLAAADLATLQQRYPEVTFCSPQAQTRG